MNEVMKEHINKYESINANEFFKNVSFLPGKSILDLALVWKRKLIVSMIFNDFDMEEGRKQQTLA